MSSIPPLAAYSYDGAWFLAKALDNVVRNHGIKLENITTGNETFYELLTSSLSSVTFTGITVRKLRKINAITFELNNSFSYKWCCGLKTFLILILFSHVYDLYARCW